MSLLILRTIIVFAMILLMPEMALSGPLEDGFLAYGNGDSVQANKIWLPLAIKGDVRAQFFLSELLEKRKGSEEDEENAKKWLTASANNGFVPARFNLGNNYHQGKYGSVNNKMAEYWWNQAAIQGFAEAQYHLATLYYWGKHGVKLNLKEAFYWFEQASSQGYQDASEAVLLIRAGEPLPVPKIGEPDNISYDDPRIVAKLSLESGQRPIVKQDEKGNAAAPELSEKTEPEAEAALNQHDIGKESVSAPTVSNDTVSKEKSSEAGRTDNGWVLRQPAANYTIQLFASTSESECKNHTNQLMQAFQLETHIQPFSKGRKKYCAVIYGSYGSYAQAKPALSQLPRKIRRTKPWIRKMAR